MQVAADELALAETASFVTLSTDASRRRGSALSVMEMRKDQRLRQSKRVNRRRVADDEM